MPSCGTGDCLAFLGNKREVVRDVAGDSLQECSQAEWASFAVATDSLEVGCRNGSQDCGHLLANVLDQFQFTFEVSIVIGEFRGKLVGVSAEEGRLVFGERPLHAVGVNRLKVGEVCDEFERAPFARNRSREEFVSGHPCNRLTEALRAAKIFGDQVGNTEFRKIHGCLLAVLRELDRTQIIPRFKGFG